MIYIAKYEYKVKGEYGIEITDKTITKEEFDAFFKTLDVMGNYISSRKYMIYV